MLKKKKKKKVSWEFQILCLIIKVKQMLNKYSDLFYLHNVTSSYKPIKTLRV